MTTLPVSAIWLAILASGLMGGLFFAFSVSVMTALGRLPAPEGIAAMQAINRAILNPIFLVVYFGTALLDLVLALAAVWLWDGMGTMLLAAGGAVYVIGVFVVTMLVNVPMNTALDGIDPKASASTAHWRDYLRRWTRWNHVRAAAAMMATLLLLASLPPGGP
ncbi:anthrone oxygenase family protein [Marinivivus vitaminiproducens]|uniref:anthrone oxygenase family protein n=1 Tax=Marinivivus vitaminiproducens TaxID=3035935 RepID=UPI00279F80C2|nr:DUF1772 domain-containing protein [Geminicoccaceae bacterium SCSIO 64248]